VPENFKLLTDISIILVTAGVAVVLFRRLHLPAVLGYLVAGLIVGPYTPPFAFVQDVETIQQLADFGIILLLFSLGLDFNFSKLRQVGVVATIVASLETIFSLFLGYVVGRLLGWSIMDSIFIAAALSISSTAIVVKILTDMGKTNLISSRITFGILIIEDFFAVLMMILLSGVAGAKGLSWDSAGFLSLKLLVVATAALVLGRIVVPWILERVARVNSSETLVVMVLGLTFSMALITNAVGLSVAAGAFLIGAIISESRHMEEIRRLLSPIRDMFGALFFVTMGMLIDISTLGSYWAPVLLITVFAILTKIILAFLGTYMSGYDGKTSLRVGTALSQRGEFSLIIAKIGRETPSVGSFVYPVVAGVSLATTLISPYLIHHADGIAGKISRLAPRGLREYMIYLGSIFHALRRSAARQSSLFRIIQQSVPSIAINLLIIGVFLLSGSFVLELGESLAIILGIGLQTAKEVIGILTIVLCIPSAIAIWRSLRAILDATVEAAPWGKTNVKFISPDIARLILRNTILIVLLVVLGIISMPLMLRLVGSGLNIFLSLTGLAVAAIIYLLWGAIRGFHRHVEKLYRDGLLGEAPGNTVDAESTKEKAN